MAERGHTVLAIVPSKSVLHQELSTHTFSISLITIGRLFNKFRWWTFQKLTRVLNDYDPDVVVIHKAVSVRFNHKFNLPANRRWPLISFVPGPLYENMSGMVDAIIPHTKSQANVNYHTELIDPNFLDVVPVFSRFVPVERIERKSRIRNLIAVGRLDRVKGFEHLIEAMLKLTKKGYDLKLNIVGIGPEEENLIRLRDNLNLADVVQFTGESYQVESLMRQADLFILSSIFEPFGIVLLEAMASGLPIVATKTNGPAEIFDDSSAVLVDSESATALSEGVQLAIQDLDATYQRASAALELYKNCYTADVVIPRYIEVFQHCIEQRNRLLAIK